MILTLEVTSPTGRDLPAQSRLLLRDTGCTIGRSTANSVVLPDRSVSSRHARILYANGGFQIEDPGSTNGVFVNSLDNHLPPNTAVPLRSGDVILIDPYEIRVVISADEQAAPAFGSPFAQSDRHPDQASYVPSPGSTEDLVDPFQALFPDANKQVTPSGPRFADLAPPSPENEPFKPPRIEPAPPSDSAIPGDYDPAVASVIRPREPEFERPQSKPVSSSPPVMRPPAPVSPDKTPPTPVGKGRHPGNDVRNESNLDLSAVLAGAGIDASVVTPEVARDFGRILRVVVEGLMDLLQSRQKIKEEFRLPTTSFKPKQNNPLKFSANVDDALHNLLVKRNAAYLGPVEAFEDAFGDVRNHQMAVLEGLRVAFEATLQAFDPDALQKEFDKLGKGSLISVPAKLRYWEMYRGKFCDMVSDAEKCFRELFGDQFAKAYESQLKRLKDQQGSGRPLL